MTQNGEVTFAIQSKLRAGTVYLQASSDSLIGAVDSFQTVAGQARTLKLIYDATPLLANGTSTREVRLQLQDANGNLRKQDNNTFVGLGVSGVAKGGGGTRAVKGGEAVFNVEAGKEPGLIQLRANAGGLPEALGVIVVGAVLPNLNIAQPPAGPNVIAKGESHTLDLHIRNSGLDSVRTAFDVVLLLVGGEDSVAVGRTVVSGPIAPDSTKNVVLSFTVPSFAFDVLASDYHWVASVDAGGFVVEQNENDNTSRGNTVAFPELNITATRIDFETVLPDSVFDRYLLVENRGLAELRFQVTSTNTQLFVDQPADTEIAMPPGSSHLIRILLQPREVGPLQAQLIFRSNDPKGDLAIGVTARVAAPDRVFFDLNPSAGNQDVTSVESNRDKVIAVELFLENMPMLQAFSIDLQFDPEIMRFETGSWALGGYFVGGFSVSDEVEVGRGLVRLGGGSVGYQAVAPEKPIGTVRFLTPSVLPTHDVVLKTNIEAVQIKFVSEKGVRDSLQIQATANLIFNTQAIWPDLNGSGRVGFEDFLIFVAAFRRDENSSGWDVELPSNPFPYTPYRRFDIDGDGQIGFFDFVTYAQDFRKAVSAQQ